MSNIETVQQIYAEFGRGDVPAILARLAEDIEWEHDTFPNPLPWLQPRRGRTQVGGFFEALAALDFQRFEPKHFFADGNLVVALVDVEFVLRANGRRVIEKDELHLWRFNPQGLVQRFRHRVDVWQQVSALKGE